MAPNNPMTCWGNDKTMNLNHLILTNIQSSPYFKVQLFELKTFHEVVDEVYYKVEHLEPWEKGSRKTAGQTGMCGGVRGVGAGGIVSSAYCLLYKLFTLKLTKKQVNNLITHRDSPYIRGLGFMYIRYTQNPQDLWDWYEDYLDDDEELDVKAGGGHFMTVGEMLRQWLVKLEWYSTLFPRIPVPIQKEIDVKMRSRPVVAGGYQGYGDEGPVSGVGHSGGGAGQGGDEPEHIPDDELSFGEAERAALSQRGRGGSNNYGRRDDYRNGNAPKRSPPRRQSPPNHRREHRRSPPRHRSRSPRHSPYSRSGDDFSRELERERDRQRKEKEDYRPSKSDKHRSKDKERRRSRSRSVERKRSRSPRERKRSRSPREKEPWRSRSNERNDERGERNYDRYERSERKEHSHKHKHKDHRREEKKKSKHKDKERDRERKHY